MANFLADPHGYGNFIGMGSSTLGGANLVLTNWIPDVIRYSKDLLVFPQFLEPRPEGFGRMKGDRFRLPIYSWNSVATTALTEGTTIEVRTQTVGSIDVTLNEYGDGISKVGETDYISNINNAEQVQRTLAQVYADTFNALCAEVIDSGHFGFRSCDTSGSYFSGTNLTDDSLKGTGNISGSLIEAVYDQMRGDKVQKFESGLYYWVGNAVTLRPVKRMAGWENMQLYNRGGVGLTYQILGDWQGFRWIETQEWCVNQKSYAFGRQVGVYSFAKPLEIYYYPDFYDDAGRLQVWKWHTILGLGPTLRDKGTTCQVVKTGMS